MGWRDVAPSEEVEAADWIRERLHPFGQDVGSVVPPGLAAYARIFHPASYQFRMGEVRWVDVARWNGKTVHPEMQFHSIGGPWNHEPQGLGPRIGQARIGALSAGQMGALVGLLADRTATSDASCLCLWEGYGQLYPGKGSIMMFSRSGAPEVGDVPFEVPEPEPVILPKRRVSLPGRDYILYRGSVAQAQGWDDGPNLWWPEDRAWCVASEIDFPYTYVGGSEDLIAEILRHPAIEALPAKLSDGITYYSDKINSP